MSALPATLSSTASPLFEPFDLHGLPLSNRLIVAPMTRVSATAEGLATDVMRRYYQRFAQGGFALIVSEGLYTDPAFSQAYAHQPGLSDVAQAKAWRAVVDAVHAAGARIVAQLMHAGALTQGNRFRGETVAPSAVPPRGRQMAEYRGSGPYPVPRAMREEEIVEAVVGFSRAAILATEVAGFDGVEVHGANGYLLDQFMTDYTNLRGDHWGGDVAGRIRLTAEVVRAIRQALGPQAPVGVRISQAKVNDVAHRWPEGVAAAQTIFAALADAGASYIHTTEHEAWRSAFDDEGPSLLRLARQAAPGVTQIANGGVHDAARAQALLADGADLVALGRSALANPAWPQRVQAGQEMRPFDAALLEPLATVKPSET